MTTVIILTSPFNGDGRSSLLTALARRSPGRVRVLDASEDGNSLPGIAAGALTRGRLRDIPAILNRYPTTNILLVDAGRYDRVYDQFDALTVPNSLVVVSSCAATGLDAARSIVSDHPGSILVANQCPKAKRPLIRRLLGESGVCDDVDGAAITLAAESNSDVLSNTLDIAADCILHTTGV